MFGEPHFTGPPTARHARPQGSPQPHRCIMDQDERIAEFRNSLPEDKREEFDSLPYEYKQTLIDPEAIKKLARESLNTAADMRRAPAKLPSFPAPYSLPGTFLDELDEHPVVTFIQIKKDFDKEFSAWVAGCCQYLGSFIELNSDNFYVNLTHCHLNRRNIEACAKLLYLSGVIQEDKHSMNYFTQLSSEITASFYPLDTSGIPAGTTDLNVLGKYLEQERQRQRPDRWFEDWKQVFTQELQEFVEKKEQAAASPPSAPQASANAKKPTAKKKPFGCFTVCLLLAVLIAVGAAFLY